MQQRSILQRLMSTPTTAYTAVAASLGGIASSVLHGVNAVADNNLSKEIAAAKHNATVLAEKSNSFEKHAYDNSRRSGITLLSTFALPTAVLTISAASKWEGIDGFTKKITSPIKNWRFSLGTAMQIAGMYLCGSAANKDGAHDPQAAIAFGMGGMALLNAGNLLVLSSKSINTSEAAYASAPEGNVNDGDMEAGPGAAQPTAYQPPPLILSNGPGYSNHR